MNAVTQPARAILARALQLDESEIGDQASIDTLAKWDSLGHMRLVASLEEILGRTLEADEILALDRVEAISRLVGGATS